MIQEAYFPVLSNFLNAPRGMAVRRDVLFVSDPAGNAIYRLDTAAGNSIQILVKDPRLGGPNGLVHDIRHDTLIVVTGRGQVVAVNADGAFRSLLGKSFGSLYGVDFDRAGNLIVSDFQRDRLIHIKNYSEVSTLKENLLTPGGHRLRLPPSPGGGSLVPGQRRPHPGAAARMNPASAPALRSYFCNSAYTASRLLLASPNSMRVFSLKNSGFCTPA